MHSRTCRLTRILLAVAAALTATAGVADAASVAYIDKGEVWLASLDGTQRVQLAGPVVNGAGEREEWLDVAQSDAGRIVAVRNRPGRISSFSWFKVWEPDGTSTVEGPLNAPPGWATYVYPLGFDISANGTTLVYGYSNSGFCCPITFRRGSYVRPATNSTQEPLSVSHRYPGLVGSRMVAVQDASNPSVVGVQNATSGNPYNDEFTPWLDVSGTGLDLNGVDVAADGRLVALGLERWENGTQTTGKIGVLAIQGLDQAPAFPAAVDCFIPATGIARDASLSPDSRTIAWRDGDGVKVAGAPTTTANPCAFSSAPVLISATGSVPSLGGASLDAFLPKPAPPTTPGSPTPTPTPAGTPVVTVPARPTVKALSSARGLPVSVKVTEPGAVSVTGTVPARRLKRRGGPVVVASGARTASQPGTVSIRVRLTARGRRSVRRLRGARLTLRVRHRSSVVTRTVVLR